MFRKKVVTLRDFFRFCTYFEVRNEIDISIDKKKLFINFINIQTDEKDFYAFSFRLHQSRDDG